MPDAAAGAQDKHRAPGHSVADQGVARESAELSTRVNAAGAPEMPEPIQALMNLATKMMRDSWATGDDAAWQPGYQALEAEIRAYGQAMAEHERRVDIEAMAGVINDAAIRYAGGHETDWTEVAKQALAAAQQKGAS